MFNGMIEATVIFAIAYAFIVSEKIHKTLIVLLGVGAYFFLHLVPFEEAIHHIDMNVILLLIGMMVIVSITEKSGVFEWIAIWAAKKVKAGPKLILTMLIVITAVFSAFLDNVTTVLLIGPVSLLIAKQLKIDPMAFLVPEIFSSNLGGTATLIGDPPNIMIGSAAGLSFMDFLLELAPLISLQIVIFIGIFILIFRKKLIVSAMDRAKIMDMDESRLIKNKSLLIKSLIVLGSVILGFMLHGLLEVEASIIALVGASILIIWTKSDTDQALKKVEWSTLMFFIGLFMMVGGLVHTGAIGKLADLIMKETGGDIKATSGAILWFSGIASGILDNIPLVATFIPVVKEMGTTIGQDQIMPIWWSLSLGACLGGNGTIIGASANVIMMDFAKRNNIPLNFMSFLKYSALLTILSLAISYVYVMLRFF